MYARLMSGVLLLALIASTFVTIPVLAQDDMDDGGSMLTLLHNNDGESSLLPSSGDIPVGGVAAYKAVVDREIREARQADHSVVNVYAGDAFLASATLQCTLLGDEDTPVYDALAQQQIGYTAHVIGNHEFDLGPSFLERFIREFDGTQPFLSANLDFSEQAGFEDLYSADGLLGDVVGRSLIYHDPDTGYMFGIVGATTWALPTISAPGDVQVISDDMESTAEIVQAEIDALMERGVNKIIFVSHLQNLLNDRDLIGMLSGVDLAVAGGGDELLISEAVAPEDQLLPGDDAEDAEAAYPFEVEDQDGRTVYVVTTPGSYHYLGRLDVMFDADGEVTRVVEDMSYLRRVIPNSRAANQAGFEDTVRPNSRMTRTVDRQITRCLNRFNRTGVAETGVVLDVSRDGVRGRETNAGNLVADSYVAAYDRLADANDLDERSADNPVVGIQNGGGIRQTGTTAGGVLPENGRPGDITLLNTFDLLPFDNLVTVVENITPQNVQSIFSRSGERIGGGQFLQVSGLRVTYTAPDSDDRTELVSVILEDGTDEGTPLVSNGRAVRGAPTITIVTNSFTAAGGDDYEVFENKDDEDRINLRTEDEVLIRYEQSLRDYLTIELDGQIMEDDPRYQDGGEGRITFEESESTTE